MYKLYIVHSCKSTILIPVKLGDNMGNYMETSLQVQALAYLSFYHDFMRLHVQNNLF